MFLQNRSEPGGIALGKESAQAFVLSDNGGEIRVAMNLEPENYHDLARYSFPDTNSERVPGQRDRGAMKVDIRKAKPLDIRSQCRLAHCFKFRVEFCEVRGVGPEFRNRCGKQHGFEGYADAAHFPDLPIVKRRDPPAASRRRTKDSLKRQLADHLAYRYPAHTEFGGKFILDQPVPGRERTGRNGGNEAFDNLFGYQPLSDRLDSGTHVDCILHFCILLFRILYVKVVPHTRVAGVEMRTALIDHVSVGAILGESPIWLPDSGVFLWLDLLGRKVHRFDPHRRENAVVADGFSENLACLVRLSEGHVLLVTATKFVRLDPVGGTSAAVDPPLVPENDTCFNDGKVAPDGSFWLGTSDVDETESTGSLYRIAGTQVDVVDRGFVISNGPAFLPVVERRTSPIRPVGGSCSMNSTATAVPFRAPSSRLSPSQTGCRTD